MRIFLAIKSSWSNLARRDACRATWIQGFQEHLAHTFDEIDYKFILGAHAPTKPFALVTENLYGERDIACVNVPDDFKHMGAKVSYAAYCSRLQGYDYTVIMDDDTYLRPERLIALAEEMDHRGGHCIAYMREKPTYPQGAMYMVNTTGALALISNDLSKYVGPDDVGAGEALALFKLNMLHTGNINPGSRFTDNFPLKTNNIISTHKCLPPQMHMAHRLWLDSHENV